jgi:hypothetical protein
MAGAAERVTGQVGVAFGITILASIYDGDLDRFAPAFAVGAVFAVLGAVTAWGMLRRTDAELAAAAPSAAASASGAGGTPVPADADADAAATTAAPAVGDAAAPTTETSANGEAAATTAVSSGAGAGATRAAPVPGRSVRSDDCGDRAGYGHQAR